jgi:hypothetical protein
VAAPPAKRAEGGDPAIPARATTPAGRATAPAPPARTSSGDGANATSTTVSARAEDGRRGSSGAGPSDRAPDRSGRAPGPGARAPLDAPVVPSGDAAGGTASHASVAAAQGRATGQAGIHDQSAIDAPGVPSTADRAVAEALDRIRTTVTAGIPGLESRIEDPALGTIRVVVSGGKGELIHAELVTRDPEAARALAVSLERALAAGAALPAGVELRVRPETTHRPEPARGDAGQDVGHQPGGGGAGHGQAAGREAGDPTSAIALTGDRGHAPAPHRSSPAGDRVPTPTVNDQPTAARPSGHRGAIDVRA